MIKETMTLILEQEKEKVIAFVQTSALIILAIICIGIGVVVQ